jgi:hypothetical protein
MHVVAAEGPPVDDEDVWRPQRPWFGWFMYVRGKGKGTCVIFGFHRRVNHISALLRFSTAGTLSSLPTFRENLSVLSSRVPI